MTGNAGNTIRQAAYDLRKLRGKNLTIKPGRTRRYQVPPDAVRIITALLTLRDHVIAPILAGIRSPAAAARPHTGPASTVTIRLSGSACKPSSVTWASKRSQQPHRQHFVDRRDASGYVPSGTSPGRNGPFGAVRLTVSDESDTFSAWLMTSRRGMQGC